MAKTGKAYDLVIVESPAKAKTIGQFLGEGFEVKSSYGHIRDLKKNNFGVDVENNYMPEYVIPDDKLAVVSELKKLASKAGNVWLASDEDREGEAISWHLSEVLGLDVATTKRIVFHEITKEAIQNAVKSPRTIDMNLVNAQQARRVLDRLVGFELSPVLWRKVKPSLSAGRVQSVAVRILVEREREIFSFVPQSSYQTTATFVMADGHIIKGELNKRFDTCEEAEAFLMSCQNAEFSIVDVEKKPVTRVPAPPFTTSTLQQEASRKLGFSVSQTMSIAQKLYEAGLITYMRTDSVNLADVAINTAASVITETMGKQYHKVRKFKTKAKGAQEAHEAIRPTYLSNQTIDGTSQEKRLYDLIWKRTIASQMSDAKLERTNIRISSKEMQYEFVSTAEVVVFDGFLKVYAESTDDEVSEDEVATLPSVNISEALNFKDMQSRERWSQKPARYSEASLVRKLEELGIGRPSTYAPTISTIQQRGYVVKENRDGVARPYKHLTLTQKGVTIKDKEEKAGAEKSKLFPTDIGMLVNDFLLEHFEQVMSYDFTANVEKQFDDIAEGELQWQEVISQFYKPFNAKVKDVMENSQKNTGERILGVDPKTGKTVSVRVGRFGPMAQIGDSQDENDKPQYSSLQHGQHIETITLEEALALFELPRTIGEYEGKNVVIGVGRFGPYIRHNNAFTSLKKGFDDPYTINLETAIERIEEKRKADSEKLLKEFAEDVEMKVLNGRWGPYIAYGKNNVKIPKGTEVAELTYEICKELCDKALNEPDGKKTKSKTSTTITKKKAVTKKVTTKK
jgi:DNA topoisomerase-1